MHQFAPVQLGSSKSASYRSAVTLGLVLNIPNQVRRVGAQLFTRLHLVTLIEQVRATSECNVWLCQLRQSSEEYPVTDEWLPKLKVLSNQDFKNKEGK